MNHKNARLIVAFALCFGLGASALAQSPGKGPTAYTPVDGPRLDKDFRKAPKIELPKGTTIPVDEIVPMHTINPPVVAATLGRPRNTIQQTIDGVEAGNSVKASTRWNEKRAPGADADLQLLASPDPGNPRSARQTSCDATLKKSQDAYDKWAKDVAGRSGVPESMERFPAWYRTMTGKPEARDALPVATALAESLAKCFSDTPADFPPGLARSVGALVGSDGVRFCSALRIGANRVATARHCVERSDGTRFTKAEAARLTVQLPEVRATPFAVRDFAKVPTRDSVSIENDWAVLEIVVEANQVAQPLQPASRALVLNGARVVIGGLLLGPDAANDPDRAKYSSALSCLVVYATDSCLVHTCNTLPGLSGAPVFVQAGGEWRFAAVHSRAGVPDDLSGACKPRGDLNARPRVNVGAFASAFLK